MTAWPSAPWWLPVTPTKVTPPKNLLALTCCRIPATPAPTATAPWTTPPLADYGITGNGSAYLVGTFTIGSNGTSDAYGTQGNLSAGYTTFESAATGSLSDGNATIIDSNVNMGSAAQAGIANDINTNQAVRFAIVADDTNVGASWTPYSAGGNVTTNPQLVLNYTGAPVVSLSASSYSVTERDQNSGNTTPITITVNDPYAASASSTTYIDYSTANGTASSPGDYTGTSGLLAFAPGNTTQTFTVNAVDENTTTTSKTFYVNLTDAGNNTPTSVITTGNATVTVNYIQNLVVTAGNATFNETVVNGNVTGGNVTINFTRSSTGTINGNSSFNWTTSDGTPYTTQGNQTEGNAEAGRDYGYGVGNTTAVSGTYTFTGNQTTGNITIPILAADTFAGTRTFTVNLSSPALEPTWGVWAT